MMYKYDLLTQEEKKKLIKRMYEEENFSFKDIANKLNTYANKIRRDAIKYNIRIRDKSEAQKNALITGKHNHPTKGKKREEKTKRKIGSSVLASWQNLDISELNKRKQKAKENWENLSQDEKLAMQQKANEAVRQASKEGSKLERFLVEKLLEDGYKIEFHKEQTLANTKLQIDIFIPKIGVAIEVDGPSHFVAVWGDENLKRNVKYDQKKTGLILGKGLILIRIKQTMDFSISRSLLIYEKLKKELKNINTLTSKTIFIKDK
jgi:hypothetical protein